MFVWYNGRFCPGDFILCWVFNVKTFRLKHLFLQYLFLMIQKTVPMAKKFLIILSIPLLIVLIIKLLSFTNIFVASGSGHSPPVAHDYSVYALPLPEKLTFAGEPVPIHNFEVRERFDRELLVNSYWQSQTLLFFKRAHRWFPVIELILEEQGVPDDFKYLALIESGLMNVVSPAGATGFWQILQSTGRELGLEVNREVDERYHVEKSTIAAADYLKSAYDRYESWTLAAAAYNMGRSALNRQLSRQRVQNYYDLLLNDETSRYMFRILAVKTIFENPPAHGFNFMEEDLYTPLDYYTVEVDSTINDLVDFAHQHEVTYKELRTLNPWLRQRELNNSRNKTYQIKITKESLYGYEYPVMHDAPHTDAPVSPGEEPDL